MERVRSQPHTVGLWATHIYFPAGITIDLPSGVEPETSPHLSLSRTLYLPRYHIEPMVELLRSNLLGQSRFTASYTKWSVYQNEEKTRSFLALDVQGDVLAGLLNAVDSTVKAFGYPPFYQPPSYHVSVAWSTGQIELPSSLTIPKENLSIDRVVLKAGHFVYEFGLE